MIGLKGVGRPDGSIIGQSIVDKAVCHLTSSVRNFEIYLANSSLTLSTGSYLRASGILRDDEILSPKGSNADIIEKCHVLIISSMNY